jgi:hypothetical protein
LQKAIDDHEACAAYITALNSGQSAARARVDSARTLVDAATEQLRLVEEQAIEFQIGVAVGTVSDKARAPLAAAARATLADAESSLELAQTTYKTIGKRLDAAEEHLRWLPDKVKTAALAVLRHEAIPVSAALVEEIERAWQLVPLLQWLVSNRAAVGVAPHSPAWTLLGNLPEGRQDESVRQWQVALAKLQKDPNAKLPDLDLD